MPRRLGFILAGGVALSLVAATGIFGQASPLDVVPSVSSGSATRLEAVTGATAAVPTTKILTVVIENHSLRQMQHGMPYLNRLAKRYGYASNYHAITHPSLPNYLAIAFGTTAKVKDDKAPSAHHVHKSSIFSLANKAGTGARVYAESMRTRCQKKAAYPYAVKHNPWAYGSSGCVAGDVTAGTPQSGRLRSDAIAGRLPCAGMLIPNLINDAHDSSLAKADSYLKKWLPTLMAGPDFRSGRLVIVVTADEDNHSSRANRVLTVVISRSVSHKVVKSRLTHYSLTRLYNTVCHEGRYLGKASSARSMRVRFGLKLS